ncbi:MAG TPA: helicase-related protein, partial [Candidatus Kapabacteria bacterium]|nr:helicase-related protein [Candidatus Kapabacteria bacterium]
HFEYIQKEIFPEFACGLLHGQMFWYEKEETMQKFAAGQFQIFVATTVIEVGIDVPNATIMLIEDAERFGLSQLHQLRGRVGRGGEQSYCILLTKDKFKNKLKNADDSERLAALVRLRTMEQTTNGFEIAEVDLKLRGPGDILGKRQSGLPEFKYADLVEDREILEAARTFAANIIADDPNLSKPENRVLKYQIEQKFTSSENYYGIA